MNEQRRWDPPLLLPGIFFFVVLQKKRTPQTMAERRTRCNRNLIYIIFSSTSLQFQQVDASSALFRTLAAVNLLVYIFFCCRCPGADALLLYFRCEYCLQRIFLYFFWFFFSLFYTFALKNHTFFCCSNRNAKRHTHTRANSHKKGKSCDGFMLREGAIRSCFTRMFTNRFHTKFPGNAILTQLNPLNVVGETLKTLATENQLSFVFQLTWEHQKKKPHEIIVIVAVVDVFSIQYEIGGNRCCEEIFGLSLSPVTTHFVFSFIIVMMLKHQLLWLTKPVETKVVCSGRTESTRKYRNNACVMYRVKATALDARHSENKYQFLMVYGGPRLFGTSCAIRRVNSLLVVSAGGARALDCVPRTEFRLLLVCWVRERQFFVLYASSFAHAECWVLRAKPSDRRRTKKRATDSIVFLQRTNAIEIKRKHTKNNRRFLQLSVFGQENFQNTGRSQSVTNRVE